jgi:hypothetical protein
MGGVLLEGVVFFFPSGQLLLLVSRPLYEARCAYAWGGTWVAVCTLFGAFYDVAVGFELVLFLE